MANIAVVPGSDIDISSGSTAVKLDAGRLNVRRRGAEAIAGALDQWGDQIGGVEQDLQKAKEVGIAADVDLKMRTAQQTFVDSLKGDSNQDQWVDRAREVSQTVQDDVFSTHENVPPRMKAQISAALKGWSGGLQLQAKTMADVQTVHRAFGQVQQDYNATLVEGSPAAAQHAQNLIDQARRNKMADPAQLDQMSRDIPRTIARNYINTGLANNPQGTYELLKSGAALPAKDQFGNDIDPKKVLGPKGYEQILIKARTQTGAWQRTNFTNMLQNDRDPITGLIDQESIKAKIQSGEIDPRVGQAKIDSQNRLVDIQSKKDASARVAELRELAREDTQRYKIITTKIHNSDRWTDKPDDYAHELIGEAAAISNPVDQQKAINDVNKQLAAVKKKGSLAEGPVEKQTYKLMNEDREKNGAMIPTQVTDVPGKKGDSHWFSPNDPDTPATTQYQHYPGGVAELRKWLNKPDTKQEDIEQRFGKGATAKSVVDAEQSHFSTVFTQMHEWFQSPEGQKATQDQADEHRKSLERPFVMEAAKQTLSQRAPVEVKTGEELARVPTGGMVKFNGATYSPNLTSPDQVKKLPSGAPFFDAAGKLRYAK